MYLFDWLRRLLITRKKGNLDHFGYLHIGSGLPLIDMQKASVGKHALVDPAIASLGRMTLFFVRKKYPCFEFSASCAKDFLRGEIRSGRKYHTVRLDMPHIGLIDEASDFAGLCSMLYAVLVPSGNVLILTDFVPDKKATLHGIEGLDADGMQKTLQSICTKRNCEKEKLFGQMCSVHGSNIVESLTSAGFETCFFETCDPRLIVRSPTAKKRAQRNKRIYLVVAKKTI